MKHQFPWKGIKEKAAIALEAPAKIQRSVAMALVIAIMALLISIAGMVRNAH